MDRETIKKVTKENSVLADFPCLKEKKLVDKCYNETNFDMDACIRPITNYQTCKQFWGSVEKARRAQGVRPFKPGPEERARIQQYYKTHRELPKFPLEADPS